MNRRLPHFLATALTVAAIQAGAAAPSPRANLLQMRLRSDDTATEEIWRSNLCAFAQHPGCCDEVWFSTGTGAPSLDWHRERARILARAVEDLRKLGISPSLQFQATLGHGDSLAEAKMFTAKDWTGWTDSNGLETRYCNCPRQPKFLAYLADVSRIYARLGFKALWIDDDLRFNNHRPANNDGKRVGCWCSVCLGAFNRENGTSHSREELAKAVETDPQLAARWRTFSIASLLDVARVIAGVFKAESPETMMALQQGNWTDAADSVRAILTTLRETSGRPVGYRPGGGAYYDDNPNLQVVKSLKTCFFRKLVGDPDWVCEWTPEIESWPRTYYSRSPQGVLIEGFTALMYGMNRISFFISNSSKESPELYGRTFWKALAAAAPVLRGYAGAIEGCHPLGFTLSGESQIGIRRAAIPVLAGVGTSCGDLTKAESQLEVNMMTSADVQRLREELDRRAGELPAVVRSPFLGLMQIHVDKVGRFRTVALVNTRISPQGPVRLCLRKLPDGAASVVWQALGRPPVTLPLEKTAEGAFVTIPSIDAWSAGYLSVGRGMFRD